MAKDDDFQFVVLDKNNPYGNCELCGEFTILRPYGPNREMIWCECGEKQMDSTMKQFLKTFLGDIPEA